MYVQRFKMLKTLAKTNSPEFQQIILEDISKFTSTKFFEEFINIEREQFSKFN